ncbi:MAG: hypothetical protein U0U66_07360 [Cytophagaceae bacterium]
MTNCKFDFLTFKFNRLTPPATPFITSSVGYYVLRRIPSKEFNIVKPQTSLRDINIEIAGAITQFHYSDNKTYSITFN